jgi:hypothetical protein
MIANFYDVSNRFRYSRVRLNQENRNFGESGDFNLGFKNCALISLEK